MSTRRYALCYCTDGQHAEPDRESFRLDRLAVEQGLNWAGRAMPLVHEVMAVERVSSVPFVDVALARYREDVIRAIEAEDAARAHAADLDRAARMAPR